MITVFLPGAVGRKTVRALRFEEADHTIDSVEVGIP
jgi:hypothetical protein